MSTTADKLPAFRYVEPARSLRQMRMGLDFGPPLNTCRYVLGSVLAAPS